MKARELQRPTARKRSAGPDESVQRILDAALASIATHGLRQLSMSQVCRVAGVARGTLYRYFPTREDLLERIGDAVRERFEEDLEAVLRAETPGDDPVHRLRSVARFLAEYAEQVEGEGMLRAEPQFVLGFLTRHVDDYAKLIQRALAPLFDCAEGRQGRTIDRRLWSQIIVRCNLSLYLTPGQQASRDAKGGVPRIAPEAVISWLLSTSPDELVSHGK